MAGGVSIDAFVALSTIFAAFAIAVVGLRFWALRLTQREFDWSDSLIVIGVIFMLGTAISGYLMVYIGGAGLHMTVLNEKQMVHVLKLFIAASPLWGSSSTAIKLSILSFYMKTFRGAWMQRAIYITGTAALIMLVLTIVEPFCQCTPFKFTWDKYHSTGKCRNMEPFLVAIAAINLIIDVTIFCIPLPILWGLKMNVQKKVHLSFIFLLGLIVCIMSSMRIRSLYQLSQTDFTWSILDDCLWAILEVTLGIINACLPFLRPLMKKLNLPFFGASKNQSRSSKSYLSFGERNTFASNENNTVSLRRGLPNLYHAQAEANSLHSLDKGPFENGRIAVQHSVCMSVDVAKEPRESNFV